METPIEKVYDLLKRNAENVSANHWINAIHEDKFENLAEDIVKLFTIPDASGSASDFYTDLMKLINAYCKQGLKKPDLVHKMKYATESCKLS